MHLYIVNIKYCVCIQINNIKKQKQTVFFKFTFCILTTSIQNINVEVLTEIIQFYHYKIWFPLELTHRVLNSKKFHLSCPCVPL